MASQRWNRAASATTRYNAMLRQPTPTISPAGVNVRARYPTPSIPYGLVQPNVMHGYPPGFSQYQLAWPSIAPMPLGYARPTHPIPNLLGYGLPVYGWRNPTFISHGARPAVDDMPLDLSRSASPSLGRPVNVPINPVATPTVLRHPPAVRATSVVDIPDTEPARPKKKSALNEGLVQYSLPVTDDDRDVDAYFHSQESNIRAAVKEAVQRDT